ncbi:MAG: DUF4340 domain-containing protein [Verrucomicrobiota bacterium]|jgi:hypothetical protein
MNWKPTWVLLAAVAVALAFIVFVEHPAREERLLQASRLVLPGLDPASVTNIEVQPWGQPMVRAQRSDQGLWRLTQPVSYPAQRERIETLLQTLAKLEWQDRISEQELKDSPDAQEKFGFAKPPFSLLLQGAHPARRLDVGDLSPWGDQVFLYVVGNTAMYLADAGFLKQLPREMNLWRDTALLDLTQLRFQTLHVRAAGKEFDLEVNPTNRLWYMRKPVPARADNAKINGLLGQLQQMRVGAFVSDDPQPDLEAFGLQPSAQTPELTLSFVNGTNVVAALELGASPTNHPELAYARRRDLGNIVLLVREPLRAWQGAYTNFLDQHLISLSPVYIESIVVRGDDDFVVRKQTNGTWEVAAAETFPADAILMQDWLGELSNMPTEIEKAVVADFSEYGLSHPKLHYTVQFAAKAGTAAAQIDFGINQSGKVFERRADEDFVNTISREDFERLPRVSWQLRDRRVWSFASTNVVKVTIHQLGATRQLLRDPQGEWTFAPGFHGPPLINGPELEEALFRLGHLSAIYWDAVGDSGLERFGFAQADHNFELEVKGPKGVETLRMEFGSRSPYTHPYASVVRDGQRLVFEFPVDLYENFVEHDLSIPAGLLPRK